MEENKAPSDPNLVDPEERKPPLALAAFISLGIVFGDIGTSPLYTFKAIFSDTALGIQLSEPNILGVLSLVFWALLLVITLKYVTVVMRAQYEGEGGIFAMLASIKKASGKGKGNAKRGLIIMTAIIGAALLYGDGVVTPAISVVSAVEGLESVSSDLSNFIVPIALLIIIGLFFWQRVGTNRIAAIFSPLMLLWFIGIGFIGLLQLVDDPGVLRAMNPAWGVDLFIAEPFKAFFLLSLVVLCITGGEALYADLGQFGRAPIALAWFCVVWPCLLLNYFGQGAWLLHMAPHNGGWIRQIPIKETPHPFFSIIPEVMLWPMIVLAALAAIIASQAIITGAFAITRQAVQMRLLPYMRIIHTSGNQENQVFLPAVNRAMLVGCIGAVLIFPSSDKLAAAYGVAVTAVMATTSILLFFVGRIVWKWPLWYLLPIVSFFLTIDLAFLGANILKVPEGGWYPLVIALILVLLMTTWRKGRALLERRNMEPLVKLDEFLGEVVESKPACIEGTGVFMTGVPDTIPTSLMGLYRHMPVVYEKMIILSMQPAPIARLPRSKQFELKDLGNGFWLLVGHYGYMQIPNVPRLLQLAERQGLEVDLKTVSYYTRREIVVTSGSMPMMGWRKGVFAAMSRNAQAMSDVFQLPTDRVIEIGMRIDI